MKKYLYLLISLSFTLFGSNQSSFWDTYTAALRGDREAQFLVGIIYEQGMGVEQNKTIAAQWFEKSAQQGHVDAQYNTGLAYALGKGVKADQSMAMLWLQRAADQGDDDAQKLLVKIQQDGVKEKIGDEKLSIVDNEERVIALKPTVLYTKENSSVCTDNKVCTIYKTPMVFTTISKRGKYYKINGILSKKGWKRYRKEGWIDENSIDHKK